MLLHKQENNRAPTNLLFNMPTNNLKIEHVAAIQNYYRGPRGSRRQGMGMGVINGSHRLLVNTETTPKLDGTTISISININ